MYFLLRKDGQVSTIRTPQLSSGNCNYCDFFCSVLCADFEKEIYVEHSVVMCFAGIFIWFQLHLITKEKEDRLNDPDVDKSYEIFQKLKGQAVPEELYVDNTSFPETGTVLGKSVPVYVKRREDYSRNPMERRKDNYFYNMQSKREYASVKKWLFMCSQLEKLSIGMSKGEKVQDALKSMGIELTTYLKNKSEIPLTRVASDVKVERETICLYGL